MSRFSVCFDTVLQKALGKGKHHGSEVSAFEKVMYFKGLPCKTELMWVPTRKRVGRWGPFRSPSRSSPPITSSSPAPRLCEEGQPKNAGAKPRDYFCVSVPDEGGGRRGRSDGGDDLLGLRNDPPPGLSPSRILHHRSFFNDLVVKETFTSE